MSGYVILVFLISFVLCGLLIACANGTSEPRHLGKFYVLQKIADVDASLVPPMLRVQRSSTSVKDTSNSVHDKCKWVLKPSSYTAGGRGVMAAQSLESIDRRMKKVAHAQALTSKVPWIAQQYVGGTQARMYGRKMHSIWHWDDLVLFQPPVVDGRECAWTEKLPFALQSRMEKALAQAFPDISAISIDLRFPDGWKAFKLAYEGLEGQEGQEGQDGQEGQETKEGDVKILEINGSGGIPQLALPQGEGASRVMEDLWRYFHTTVAMGFSRIKANPQLLATVLQRELAYAYHSFRATTLVPPSRKVHD